MAISRIHHNALIADITAVRNAVQSLPNDFAQQLDSMIRLLNEDPKSKKVFSEVQTSFMNFLQVQGQTQVCINISMLKRANEVVDQFQDIVKDPGGFYEGQDPRLYNGQDSLDSGLVTTYSVAKDYIEQTFARHQEFLNTIGLSFTDYDEIQDFYSQNQVPCDIGTSLWPSMTSITISDPEEFRKFLSEIQLTSYKLDDETKRLLARNLRTNELTLHNNIAESIEDLAPLMSEFVNHSDDYEAIEKLFKELNIPIRTIPSSQVYEIYEQGYLDVALDLSVNSLYPQADNDDIRATQSLFELTNPQKALDGQYLIHSLMEHREAIEKASRNPNAHHLVLQVIERQIQAANSALKPDNAPNNNQSIKYHVDQLEEIKSSMIEDSDES